LAWLNTDYVAALRHRDLSAYAVNTTHSYGGQPMHPDFEQNLEKYAEVIVRVGLNLQPGQKLLIGPPFHGILGVPVELAPLVRRIVTKAYQAGARLVEVMWTDDQLRLIRIRDAPHNSLEEFPAWRADAALDVATDGGAVLNLLAEDPNLLLEQDSSLVSTYRKTCLAHLKPFEDLRVKNAVNWSVVTAPVDGWTECVFPDLPPESREGKLWDTLFDICRIREADPISAWTSHLCELEARSDHLNQEEYSAIELQAPGTDLRIGLPRGHIWKSARMTTQGGIDFTANIPTEEIFTIPHKDRTEGVVTTTMPLSFEGAFMERITLTFCEGRIVRATARKGEESLHRLLDTDEGIKHLGEVALVPHSTPISSTGLMFYNILIDENASNHIALGRAYRSSLDDGEVMSDEEFAEAGGNDSLGHIDCMIGSGEMDVDGLKEDGTSEPIMRQGEWAFDV
jgi:aminopeptidase